MLKLLPVIVLALVALVMLAQSQPAPSLKAAYPDFKLGVAIPAIRHLKDPALARVAAQFNAIVPENCMKPEPIHPQEGTWRFEDADAFMDFAQKRQMEVYGHTLVWHHQCPDWFFKDGDKKASRELVLARMKNHISTIVTRYKGKIRGWDVVNEAIADSKDDYLRKTQWLETVGEDYIEHAFRFAHEADPNLELQYNDYNIELPAKRKKTIKLIQSLLDKNVPIHSVGIQCHFRLDSIPFKELEDAIKEFSTLNDGKMKVAITELDLDVMPRETEGSDPAAREAANAELQKARACPPEVLARQAEQYAKLFALFKKHKTKIVRVTFWGLDDGHTWLNSWPLKRYNHPMLWDREGRPKPAFDAVIKAAQ